MLAVNTYEAVKRLTSAKFTKSQAEAALEIKLLWKTVVANGLVFAALRLREGV